MTDDESDTESDIDEESEDEQRGLTGTDDIVDDPETDDNLGGLEDLQESRSWEFTVEAPNGNRVQFEGSDPETDDGIAELTSPTADAYLLYWRAIKHLNDSPELTQEAWEGLAPRFRGIIATKHMDRFGLDEFMGESEVEDVMDALEAQANQNQAARNSANSAE